MTRFYCLVSLLSITFTLVYAKSFGKKRRETWVSVQHISYWRFEQLVPSAYWRQELVLSDHSGHGNHLNWVENINRLESPSHIQYDVALDSLPHASTCTSPVGKGCTFLEHEGIYEGKRPNENWKGSVFSNSDYQSSEDVPPSSMFRDLASDSMSHGSHQVDLRDRESVRIKPGSGNFSFSSESMCSNSDGGMLLHKPLSSSDNFAFKNDFTVELFYKLLPPIANNSEINILFHSASYFEPAAYRLYLKKNTTTASVCFSLHNSTICSHDIDTSEWNYLALRYDHEMFGFGSKSGLNLLTMDHQLRTEEASVVLPDDFKLDIPDGNLFIGTRTLSAGCFNGMLDEIRVSVGLVPDLLLLRTEQPKSTFATCTRHTTFNAPRGTFGLTSDIGYSDNQECEWKILPHNTDAELSFIVLRFRAFQLEPLNDIVYIFDGNSSISSPLLTLVSGHVVPSVPIVSTKNSLTIKFVSDGVKKSQQYGFTAEYEVLNLRHQECVSTWRTHNMQLTCPDRYEISQVNFASYGNPLGSCQKIGASTSQWIDDKGSITGDISLDRHQLEASTSNGPLMFTRGFCHAPSSRQVVEEKCLGKSACTIAVQDATFHGNPCEGLLDSAIGYDGMKTHEAATYGKDAFPQHEVPRSGPVERWLSVLVTCEDRFGFGGNCAKQCTDFGYCLSALERDDCAQCRGHKVNGLELQPNGDYKGFGCGHQYCVSESRCLATLPFRPRNLRLFIASRTSINLVWDAPDQGFITEFLIEWSPEFSFRDSVLTSERIHGITRDQQSSSWNLSVSQLLTGQTYYFRVVARNTAGYGNYTLPLLNAHNASRTFAIPSGPPSPPSFLHVNSIASLPSSLRIQFQLVPCDNPSVDGCNGIPVTKYMIKYAPVDCSQALCEEKVLELDFKDYPATIGADNFSVPSTMWWSHTGRVSSNSLYAQDNCLLFDSSTQRILSTNDFSITEGAVLSFDFVYSNSSSPEPNEYVVIFFTTDMGTTWETWTTLTLNLYHAIRRFTMPIPSQAHSPHTRFLWTQRYHRGIAGHASWAIDNVEITIPSMRSVVLSGLSIGKLFNIRIAAFNDRLSEQSYGNFTARHQALAAGTPGYVQNFTAARDAQDDETLHIRWSRPFCVFDENHDISSSCNGLEITKYIVEWNRYSNFTSQIEGGFKIVPEIGNESHSHHLIIGNLTTGLRYFVRVAAANTLGYGKPLHYIYNLKPAVAPDPPLNARVRSVDASTLELAFDAVNCSNPDTDRCNGHPVLSYEVERIDAHLKSVLNVFHTSSYNPEQIHEYKLSNAYTDKLSTHEDPVIRVFNLITGDRYCFRIRAISGFDQAKGDWSLVPICAIPSAPPTPPTFQVLVVNQTSVRVIISPIACILPSRDPCNGVPVTKYQIEWKKQADRNASFQAQQLHLPTDLSVVLMQLVPGTKYSVRVQAANAEGYGPYRELIHFDIPFGAPSTVSVYESDSLKSSRWSNCSSMGINCLLDYNISANPLKYSIPAYPWLCVRNPFGLRNITWELRVVSSLSPQHHVIRHGWHATSNFSTLRCWKVSDTIETQVSWSSSAVVQSLSIAAVSTTTYLNATEVVIASHELANYVVPANVPEAPALLLLSRVTGLKSSLGVQWSLVNCFNPAHDPCNGRAVEHYLVQYSDTSFEEEEARISTISVQSPNDLKKAAVMFISLDNLLPGQPYHVRIASVNSRGLSAFRNALPNVLSPASTPEPPSAITLTQLNSSTIKVLWSDVTCDNLGTDGCNGVPTIAYEIEWSSDSEYQHLLGQARVNASAPSTFLIPELQLDLPYYVRIATVNEIGRSIYGVPLPRVIVLKDVPSPPRAAQLAVVSNQSLKLEWSSVLAQNGAPVSSFRIDWSQGATFTALEDRAIVSAKPLRTFANGFDNDFPLNNTGISSGSRSGRCGFTGGHQALVFDDVGTRKLVSEVLDLTNAYELHFYLKYGHANDGFPNCEPLVEGNEVQVSFSVDAGISWVELNTYAAGRYSAMTLVKESIPAGMQTNATLVKLEQKFEQNASKNAWAIDDMEIRLNTTLSYILPNLTTSSPVFVRLSAVNAIGSSLFTRTSPEMEIPAAQPHALDTVSAMTHSIKSLRITWLERGCALPFNICNGQPIDEYHIEWSLRSNFEPNMTFSDSMEINMTSNSTVQEREYVITQLETGVAYFIRIRARNRHGWSEHAISNPKFAFPGGVSEQPSAAKVTLTSSNSALFLEIHPSEEDNGIPVSKYLVELSPDENFATIEKDYTFATPSPSRSTSSKLLDGSAWPVMENIASFSSFTAVSIIGKGGKPGQEKGGDGLIVLLEPMYHVFEAANSTSQTLIVPDGVTYLTAKIWGAGGGACANYSGGNGAFASAKFLVEPGSKISLTVGGGGHSCGTSMLGGSFGGGKGGNINGGTGAGGGGGSSLFVNHRPVIIVAGGAGASTGSAQSPGKHGSGFVDVASLDDSKLSDSLEGGVGNGGGGGGAGYIGGRGGQPGYGGYGGISFMAPQSQIVRQTLSNLITGRKYYGRVFPINEVGRGDVVFTMPTFSIPSYIPYKPTNLRTRSSSRESILVEWDAANDNGAPIINYVVETSESLAFSSFSVLNAGNMTNITVSNLTTGSNYFVRVKAVNVRGSSPFAVLSTPGIPAAVPRPPSTLSVNLISASSLEITTDAIKCSNPAVDACNGLPVTSMKVEWNGNQNYSDEVVMGSIIFDISSHQSSYTVVVDSLQSRKPHYFRVSFGNAVGYSSYVFPTPRQIIPAGDGSSEAKSGLSCATIHQFFSTQASGFYFVRPAALGQSLMVYCDMDTDNGGWTLLTKLKDHTHLQLDNHLTNKFAGAFWYSTDSSDTLQSINTHQILPSTTSTALSPFRVNDDLWGGLDAQMFTFQYIRIKYNIDSTNTNASAEDHIVITASPAVYANFPATEMHLGECFSVHEQGITRACTSKDFVVFVGDNSNAGDGFLGGNCKNFAYDFRYTSSSQSLCVSVNNQAYNFVGAKKSGTGLSVIETCENVDASSTPFTCGNGEGRRWEVWVL